MSFEVKKAIFDPWIRDPGSGIELRNHFFVFFGVKIRKFFDEDPGSGNRDGDSSDPGSGMEKSRIRDPGYTSRIRNTGEKVKKSVGFSEPAKNKQFFTFSSYVLGTLNLFPLEVLPPVSVHLPGVLLEDGAAEGLHQRVRGGTHHLPRQEQSQGSHR
jgi:hypothetical protein